LNNSLKTTASDFSAAGATEIAGGTDKVCAVVFIIDINA